MSELTKKQEKRAFVFHCSLFSCLFFVLLSCYLFFISCDNLFSNNMGEKVVVEPPTISVEYPVSGSYLSGTNFVFTGTAKAYIEVRKVEVYVFADEENGQIEVPWTDKGVALKGDRKNKTWSYEINTFNYNGGNDGVIRMKFRVHDSIAIVESSEMIYIIKNLASDIRMTAPDSVTITDPLSVSKINYGGEIQGQIIDRRGLRPGYPQIKIWPADDPRFPYGTEPGDDDPRWGWASLFLPGIGNNEVGKDDLQKEEAGASAGPGAYADRSRLPVPRAAQFSLRLAEYDIVKENEELRRIRYRVSDGKHIPFESGKTFYFRIRTKDTASDSSRGMIPTDDGPWVEGFYPPFGLGTANEDSLRPREEPVKILIFSPGSSPTIELNNEDKDAETELKPKPNIYITEPTTKKIAVGRAGRGDFRLRILVSHPEGIERVTLQYAHESTGRTGFLVWDETAGGESGEYYDPADPGKGKLFTFTAEGGLKEREGANPGYNEKIFTTSSEPYTLFVNVYPPGVTSVSYPPTRYTLYMDGKGPDVSIRSMLGAAAEPSGGAADFTPAVPGFLKNESAYTVNGNIQVVVDRTDDLGIMAYGAGMGKTPPEAGYPMVKWIVEEDRSGYDTASDTIIHKLRTFRENPDSGALEFFYNIEETRSSGWVRMPSSAPGASDADRAHNFKLNTFNPDTANPPKNTWDKKDLWLYVIAQDGVQNLGFIMQKLRVDEDSDKPELIIPTLSFENAGNKPIAGPLDLDVVIGDNRAMSGGNWSADKPRRNILEKDQGIELNFLDDDGIDADTGIVIKLTDLNGTPPYKEATLNAVQVKEALRAGNKKDMSGTLSQAVMAAALYGAVGNPGQLKDGMYKIEITVTDDAGEKVVIDRFPSPALYLDTPAAAARSVEYYFAVFNEPPEITVETPEENSLQNDTAIDIKGQVRSRLKAQRLWLTFNPDVLSPSLSGRTEELTLYADAAYTLPLEEAAPDGDGYYTYYWIKKEVVFNPPGLFGEPPENVYDWRRFSLEAYDRLGNAGSLQRSVQIDTTAPEVILIEFNHSRPVDPEEGLLYVYGKVPFTVSASDANGLMETGGEAGIRWWVLPADDPAPSWGTDYPGYGTPPWTGGGSFLLSQAKNGGRYPGVIDTRKLTPHAEYKLYIIAMDKAGNRSANIAKEIFTIDQERDNPVIDPNSVNPAQSSVKGRAGLVISGTASDGDLFDADKVNGYVKIRFPSEVDAEGGPLVWGAWINVSGSLDPAGAIKFEFKPDDPAFAGAYFRDYLSSDGTKHYQIQVSDEPDAREGARHYGKNPDGDTAEAPGYQGSVSKIFPGAGGSYRFLLDATPPEIFFNNNDPTDKAGHNYSPSRPTFSNVGQLKAALNGKVVEAHLSTLSFSYGSKSKIIIKIEDPSLPYVQGSSHLWSITTDIDADELLSPFIEAPQGPQNIVMEAVDVAGLVHRVPWTFYKDTQGPEIVFTSITRAVKRAPVPSADAFPLNWPSDFRNGSNWKSDPTWAIFRTLYGVDDWPSEYAFLIPSQVIEKLKAEDTRAPSVASGGMEENPPVIQGSFYDALSSVWTLNDDGEPVVTYFEYLFRDKAGTAISGWIPKEIKPASGGHKNNSADWEITLNSVGGFEGTDGENRLDIRIADSAGNLSEIFSVRFLVDRANPELSDPKEFTVYDSVNDVLIGPLPEAERRVFSAAGGAGDEEAFTISGRISDYNLSSLQITIGQENAALSYTVTASVEIDPLTGGNCVVGAPFDKVNGVEDEPNRRLILEGPYNPGTTDPYDIFSSPPEWEWTLSVLQKDIQGLRAAAGSGADSARRSISVIGTDKARRRTPAEQEKSVWYFYLDAKKPVIEYTNLDKGRDGASFENNTALSGIVSDDTKIKDAQYMIGRWDYAAEEWRWYDGVGWTLDDPAARDSWPSVFAGPARQTSMPWTVNQATLDAANAKNAGAFPDGLFGEEGQYRIDLYVTDWSLGNGNPHDTTKGDNSDSPSTTGFSDDGYSVSSGDGNASARVFFIDRTDPSLAWITATDNRTYFRNENGQVSFGFTAGDSNTIQKWEAVVRDEGGVVVLRGGTLASSAPAIGSIPVPSVLSFTSTGTQNLTLAPFMTANGAADGTPLDIAGGSLPKTYTITLTVVDGAKKSSAIRKQFILDNRAPEFENLRPSGYRLGDNTTWEAITGKMNVRGNTTDNSNQLKRVAFHLVKAGPAYDGGFTFPDPKDVEWHWHDPDNAGSYGIKINGTTVIQIEEGTFTWELRVPQSGLFFSDGDAKSYVQWTKTGGIPITGGITEEPYGDYRDVNIDPSTNEAVTSDEKVPKLTFQELVKANPNDKTIYGGEDVGLMTVYMLAEDTAGNVRYQALKYWLWPEGDRPQVISINNPDVNKVQAERLLNGRIRLSGMARDNEQVKYVWFRVLRPGGTPYELEIPKWNEVSWTEIAGQKQSPEYGANLGSRRDADSLGVNPDGWYMANGGGSRNVSWWAYINAAGELDPAGLDANEIIIEVRAQDVTWDDGKDNNLGGWKDYNGSYRGFASAPVRVNAWVAAGAPIFDKVFVANGTSVDATLNNAWGSIDTASIKNRSSYRVTIKHTSGLSAIRWSPTEWEKTLNSGTGGFRADPAVDEAYNLLNLADGEYVYQTGSYTQEYIYNGSYYVYEWVYKKNSGYVTKSQIEAFADLTGDRPVTHMAVTVRPAGRKTGSDAEIKADTRYLIWNWDPAVDTNLVTSGVFVPDSSHYESAGVYKNLKNTVFKTAAALSPGSYNIGNAVLIESDPENGVDYYKWNVTVDARADSLLAKMVADDPDYGNGTARAGQTKNSVRYPVYLSAADVSRPTPFSSRGDTLLPIDNLKPYAMYTLNRKPAGIAATIGGEAGDDGPVSGVAKVVLWFSRMENGTRKFISWHEKTAGSNTKLDAVTDFEDAPPSGEGWWDDNNVISEWNDKPGNTLKQVSKPYIPAETTLTDGDYAIVIDRNDPTGDVVHHGHKLAMGFTNGGMGKYWYVELNSFGINSGPVTLHYVVIDRAGNARYYYEPLIIMNNAPVISRIKLATDIRGNYDFRTLWTTNTSAGTGTAGADSPLLDEIRGKVPRGDTEVQKGITEYVYSKAMGVEKIIDFNVRNNLFALRVETTQGSGSGKDRNFRLEYVSGARLLSDTGGYNLKLGDIKAGRVYIINQPGNARWGMVGADGDGPWARGYAFLAAVDGRNEEGEERFTSADTGSVWELNSNYPVTGDRTAASVPDRLRLGDVAYTADPMDMNHDAVGAEFVYNYNAFYTYDTNPRYGIIDYDGSDAYPRAVDVNPAVGNSMFILRVFDGEETDMFGDFTIIRVRVNNNDKTQPFAQVYDINPKTEGQERTNIAQNNMDTERARSITPMFIGEGANSNRTRGGLWNTAAAAGSVAKSGHIEPRKTTSLTSAQMGGAPNAASATMTRPYADAAAFFETDTVSGNVVLRGYVEDDQRINLVRIWINGYGDIYILYPYENYMENTTMDSYGSGTPGNSGNYEPPRTGLLYVPDSLNGRVFFTDTIDLYRHRVEWAYIWDTENIPASIVVGDFNVSVVAYNVSGRQSREMQWGVTTGDTAQEIQTSQSVTNPGLPNGLVKYNSININIRPYITGFLRITGQGTTHQNHNTRSRQGRYPIRKFQEVAVSGFNLRSYAAGAATTITLPGVDARSAASLTTHYITAFGITDYNPMRYIMPNLGYPDTYITGDGVLELSVTRAGVAYQAANTSSERARAPGTPARPLAIQPWNIEYSPGIEGSELWDDFTQVHIWEVEYINERNEDSVTFAAKKITSIYDFSMSVDPATGTLWESHNEGNGDNAFDYNNTSTTHVSNNDHKTWNQVGVTTAYIVAGFLGPIVNSSIFISPRPSGYYGDDNAFTVWTAYSVTGRSGNPDTGWRDYGGVFISGPNGARGVNIANNGEHDVDSTVQISSQYWGDGVRMPDGSQLALGMALSGNTNNGFIYPDPVYNSFYKEGLIARSQYLAESAGYNAGASPNGVNYPPGNLANPPSVNQFKNPHIITHWDDSVAEEHIHVSYYDDKDGSLKYRYNRRGSAGNIYGRGVSDTDNPSNNMPYAWTNLDGGYDLDDRNPFNAPTNTGWETATGGGYYIAPWNSITNPIGQNERIVNWEGRVKTEGRGANIDAGEYNSIALNSQGHPVVAYMDKTNQKLKLAVSNSTVPIAASAWTIIPDVITTGGGYGIGQYVSMKIDARVEPNIVHIAAMDALNKNLVYVRGTLSGTTYTNTNVQVVDSMGSVGRYCTLSLDAEGNPWISYLDEGYISETDAVKMAHYNPDLYYKGNTSGEYTDIHGGSLSGWETMHVPTLDRVFNGQVGMECYPTRNYTGVLNPASRFWSGAVAYKSMVSIFGLTPNYQNSISYYVK